MPARSGRGQNRAAGAAPEHRREAAQDQRHDGQIQGHPTGGAVQRPGGEGGAGHRAGHQRTGERDITVFSAVGLAFQDRAAGWLAYTLTLQRGVGRDIDLLA